MTAEAAVVLPLFLGFLIFLLFYFRMMEVQIGIEQAMAYTARMMAATIKEEEEKVSATKLQMLFLSRISKEDISCEYVDGELDGISLQCLESEGYEVILHTSYRMTFPVGFFGTLTYPVEQEVSARKWIGLKNGESEGTQKDYVYVTKTGKVYHRSRECAYLELSIRSVLAKTVVDLRNQSGEKYRKCGLCAKSTEGSSQCYITDYGNCYHSDLGCSSLKRSVYLIFETEVGNRRECKKCRGD